MDRQRTRPGLRPGLITGIVTVAVVIGLANYQAMRSHGDVRPPYLPATTPNHPGLNTAVNPGFQGVIAESPNGSPFLFGYSMSLSDAQTKGGFAIPRPDSPLASDSQLTTIWVDTSGGADHAQLELDYKSGLHVLLGPAPEELIQSAPSQSSFFQQQASQDAAQTKGAARYTTVNGQPALVIPQNSALLANGQSQGGSGDVEFVVANEVVDVTGNFATDDLLAVASTVSARPA